MDLKEVELDASTIFIQKWAHFALVHCRSYRKLELYINNEETQSLIAREDWERLAIELAERPVGSDRLDPRKHFATASEGVPGGSGDIFGTLCRHPGGCLWSHPLLYGRDRNS